MPHMTFDRKVPVWKQRLAVMLKKSKRNHPKRHGTGKEAAAVRARKKLLAKAKVAFRDKQAKKYKAAVRAYWRGEADVHPINPV